MSEEAAVYSFVLPDGTQRQGSEGYTGEAEVEYENGDKFKGWFLDGLKEGPGAYTSSKGFVFKGSYKDNLRHGMSTLTYPDGAYYHGMYFEGKRDGHGVYRYSNSDVYIGEWSNNMKHGQGTYIFADSQSRLLGQWERGQLQSGGSWKLSGGQVYSGDFKMSKPCGVGQWTLSGQAETIHGTYSISAAPVDSKPDDKFHPPTLVTSKWVQN